MRKRRALFILFTGLVCAGASPVHADELARRWLVYGNGQYAQGQYKQALASYAASLRRDNSSATAYQGVGNCYLRLSQPDKALRYYEYSLRLKPDNTALQGLVAKLRAGQGGGAQAQGMAEAGRLYSEKNYLSAAQAYQKLIDVQPGNAKAWQGLGNSLFGEGRRDEALKAYRRSLELEPNNPALASFVNRSAEASKERPSAFQPVWRSALLPGWGQYFNGEKTKGLVVGGLTLGLLAGTAATYVIGSNAQQDYLNAKTDFDAPYATWESMAALNHTLYVLFGAAYIYAVLDAGMNARHPDAGARLDAGLPVQLGLAPGGFQLKARILEF